MISIIVPVYNVEKYVLKCLQSIQNQTYVDFEVIIVDDGSTDGSGAICETFASRDRRFRVIHQSNEGLSGARNTGIEVARGTHLMFIDSDDYIHPQMVELLYRCCAEKNAEVAICEYQMTDESDCVDYYSINWDECKILEMSGEKSCYNIYGEKGPTTVIACNKMFQRELFKEIRFPRGKLHEDEFVTYKILYGLNKVIYLEEKLYFYVQRKGSIMLQADYSPAHIVMLEMAEESILFYEEKQQKELTKLAAERAFGLCKMLYKKYAIAERKDMQKKVLERYRSLFAKYHGLLCLNKVTYIISFTYGYSPKLAQMLSDCMHRLWLIKHYR